MAAGTYNIEIQQGETFKRNIEYKDSAGVIVPLSGYKARAQVREEYGGLVLLEFTSDDDTITLSDTSPNIVLLQLDEVTRALDFGSAKWDFFLERQSDDFTEPLWRGKVKLIRAVTAAVT